MPKTIPLKELVEKRELSEIACERMAKAYITNVNELYCLIRSSLEYMDKESQEDLAKQLDISKEKLGSYMEYIKPYVAEETINPSKERNHPTGCLITLEQIEKLKRNWKAMEDPGDHSIWRRQKHLEACIKDPSFEKFCLEQMASDEEFRDWFLNGTPATRFEDQKLHDQLSVKQAEIKEKFYKENPNSKRNY